MSNPLFNPRGFLQINIGKSRLLVPQAEVRSLESTLDMHTEKEDQSSVGSVFNNGVLIAVFNFDDKFNLDQSVPDSRRICVCLQDNDIEFSIICDAVSSIKQEEINLVDLPSCMKTTYCPALFLGIYRNSVFSVVSTWTLHNLITKMSNNGISGKQLDKVSTINE